MSVILKYDKRCRPIGGPLNMGMILHPPMKVGKGDKRRGGGARTSAKRNTAYCGWRCEQRALLIS